MDFVDKQHPVTEPPISTTDEPYRDDKNQVFEPPKTETDEGRNISKIHMLFYLIFYYSHDKI